MSSAQASSAVSEPLAVVGEANDASRGSAIKLGAEIGGRVLSAVTTVVIVRALSVGEFGLFQFASAIAVVAAEVADMGLQATSARDLVAGRFGTVALLRTKLLLTGLVLAAFAVLPWLPPAGPIGAGAWISVVAPLLGYFTLAGWSEQLGVALRARGWRVHEALTILCFRAALLAAITVAITSGGGLPRILWAHVASTLPPLALGAWLLARSLRAGPREEPSMTPTALLRLAWPLGVNGLLSLLSVRVELLVLGMWATTAEAGLFGSALQFFLFLVVVPSAICAGAMPALTREALKGEGGVRARTAMTLAGLAAPAAVGLLLVPDVLTSLYGGEYAGARVAMSVLALGLPVVFFNALLLHALIAAGRAGHVARLTGLRTAAAALAAFVLVPAAGAVGASAGFVLSEMILLALAARACTSAGFAVPLVAPAARSVALCAPMAAVLAAITAPPFVEVAVGALVYVSTVAAVLKTRPRLLL